MTQNPISPIPPLSATSGTATPGGMSRFKPVDPLQVLRKYLHVLLALAVVGAGIGVGTWFALRQTMPRWGSQVQLALNNTVENALDTSSSASDRRTEDAVERALQNQLLEIESPRTLMAVLNTNSVQNTQWVQQFIDETGALDVDTAMDALEENLGLNLVGGASAIQIAFATPQPTDSEKIVDAVAEVHLNFVEDRARGETQDVRGVFVDRQTAEQGRIGRLQGDIASFLRRQDVDTLDSRASAASIEYENYVTQRAQLEMMLDQAQEQHRSLNEAQQTGQLEATPQDVVAIEAMPLIQELKAQIQNLRAERDRLLARLGPKHYQITDIDRRIEAFEAERQRNFDQFLRERQAAQIDEAAKNVEGIKAQLTGLQPKMEEATRRLKDLNAQLAEYEQMQTELEDARERLAEINTAINNSDVQASRPELMPIRRVAGPTRPELTFPRPEIIIPGITLLVLALGAGLIYLKEGLDQRMMSPSDVKLLGEAELLGVVPDAAEDPSGAGQIEGVVASDPNGLMAESFRQVRTAVMSKMDRRGYKTLLVASGQPGSGTSSAVQNLAISLSHNGRKVLVIDANFRRPVQHTLMGLRREPGLIELLEQKAEASDAIVRKEENLALLPIGAAHAATPDMLESSAFRSLLGQLETEYDLILIDAPPALLTSDTRLLAKQADAVMLVVRARNDKRGMVQRLLREIDGHRADVLGLVLNGVRASAGGYFRKSYRDFYRYRDAMPADKSGATAKR
ncbi:MAG: polysaccharide biosynthesis tyrosine autokinase [Phycisphaeraceae bacterium]